MNKIKWGILGYATIAQEAFIPALLKAANSEFYAIASRHSDKLKECQAKFKAPGKVYTDYDALLSDPEVQAVYIPLPNSLHREWAIKATQHGKHVLCEKPLALAAADCHAIIDSAVKNKVKLMEGFMYRYTDRIKKVQHLIQGGDLGEIKYINAAFYSLASKASGPRLDPDLGGGSLFDLGCYPVNFIQMITGSNPVGMAAQYIGKNGVDQIFSAVLKYPNNLIANINCGWINEFRSLSATIMGSKATLEIPEPFWGNAGSLILTTPAGRQEITVDESDRFLLEATDFADAILNDRPPMLNPAEAVNNAKVIETLIDLTWRKDNK